MSALSRRSVLAGAVTAAVAAGLPGTIDADDDQLPAPGDTSLAAVGARLRYGRECQSLTIDQAAKLADATPSEWQSWESGLAKPPARNLWLVAVRRVL